MIPLGSRRRAEKTAWEPSRPPPTVTRCPPLAPSRSCRPFAATTHPSPLVLKRDCTERSPRAAASGPRSCPELWRTPRPWLEQPAAAQASAPGKPTSTPLRTPLSSQTRQPPSGNCANSASLATRRVRPPYAPTPLYLPDRTALRATARPKSRAFPSPSSLPLNPPNRVGLQYGRPPRNRATDSPGCWNGHLDCDCRPPGPPGRREAGTEAQRVPMVHHRGIAGVVSPLVVPLTCEHRGVHSRCFLWR